MSSCSSPSSSAGRANSRSMFRRTWNLEPFISCLLVRIYRAFLDLFFEGSGFVVLGSLGRTVVGLSFDGGVCDLLSTFGFGILIFDPEVSGVDTFLAVLLVKQFSSV